MVDNECNMDIFKSVKISIGTVMRNPEMLKFIPDHLKTKKMCKHAVQKLPFRFDKIVGFIRIYDGTRYLILLGPEKYDAIYNSTRYLISLKNSIKYISSHHYVKIKVDSYDSLPIDKTLTLHNVIILIKSVLNKDINFYYYKIF